IVRHAGAREARDQRVAAESGARRARRPRSRRDGRSRGRQIAGLGMADLQIYDRRERRIVAAADRVLAIGAGVARLWPRRAPASPPRRLRVRRVERIGDVLMPAAGVESVRARAPEAAIDLVVGSWNRTIAERLGGVD